MNEFELSSIWYPAQMMIGNDGQFSQTIFLWDTGWGIRVIFFGSCAFDRWNLSFVFALLGRFRGIGGNSVIEDHSVETFWVSFCDTAEIPAFDCFHQPPGRDVKSGYQIQHLSPQTSVLKFAWGFREIRAYLGFWVSWGVEKVMRYLGVRVSR